MTSLVSCCARIVNQNKCPTLLHDRADVTVGYMPKYCRTIPPKVFYLNSQRNKNFSGSFQPFVLIRKKLVIFVHFKGFNISHKPKSSPLSYFAQKTSLNLVANLYPIIFTFPVRCDSCLYISNIDIFVH